MGLTKEQVDAHEQLEGAIAQMVRAFDHQDSGEITYGWSVIVAQVADNPCRECDHDEMDTISPLIMYVRRGQPPALTRGIMEEAMDGLRG